MELYPIRYGFFFNFASFYNMFCRVFLFAIVFLLSWNVNLR